MINKYFNKVGTIYKKESSKSEGRYTNTLTEVGTFKCRVDPQTVTKQIVGDKKTYTITDLLFAENTPEVFNGYIIEVDGKQYEAIRSIDPFTDNHHQEILLERIV